METRAGVTCEIEWASTVPRQMRDISAPVEIKRLWEGQPNTHTHTHTHTKKGIAQFDMQVNREHGIWAWECVSM